MIKKSLLGRLWLTFVITFCAPALVITAFKTYNAVGHELGRVVYEAMHE